MIAFRLCRFLQSLPRLANSKLAVCIASRVGAAIMIAAAFLPLSGCTAGKTRTHVEHAYFVRVSEGEEGDTAELFALELEATLEGESDVILAYAPAAPFRTKDQLESAGDEEAEQARTTETFMLLADASTGVRMQPLTNHDALVLMGTDMEDVIRELATLDLIASSVDNSNQGRASTARATHAEVSISEATVNALAERAELEKMHATASAEVDAAERNVTSAENAVAEGDRRLGAMIESLASADGSTSSRELRREASQLQLEVARQREVAADAQRHRDELMANLEALEEALEANDALRRLRAELSGEPMDAASIEPEGESGTPTADNESTENADASGADAVLVVRAEPTDDGIAPAPLNADRAPAPAVGNAVRRIYRYNGELFEMAAGPGAYEVSDRDAVRTLLSSWDGLLEAANIDPAMADDTLVEARAGLADWSANGTEPLLVFKTSTAEAALMSMELAMIPEAFAHGEEESGESGVEVSSLIAAALSEQAASPDLRAAHEQHVGSSNSVLTAMEDGALAPTVLSPDLLSDAFRTPLSDPEAWTIRDNLTRRLEANAIENRIGVFLSVDRDLQIKQINPDILGYIHRWWKAVGPSRISTRPTNAASDGDSAGDSSVAGLIAAELASEQPSAGTILRLLDLASSAR